MANLRILQENVADAAELSVTPAPSLPAANLQTVMRGDVMRVPGTSFELLVNLDTARYLQVISLARHNFSSLARWRIRLYDAEDQGGNVVYDNYAHADTTAPTLDLDFLTQTYQVDDMMELIDPPVPWGTFVWGDGPWGRNRYSGWTATLASKWFSRVSARSARIEVSDPGNSSGYLQAARLLMGTYLAPNVNASWGIKLSWEDPSTQVRTDGGSLLSDNREVHRKLDLSVDWLAAATERAPFLELARVLGKRRDTLVSVYPEEGGELERDYAMVAKLEEAPQSIAPHYGYAQQAMTFVEV